MKNGLEIDEVGTTRYWLNGLLHRENGPAYIDLKGNKSWYHNGLRHRLNGPACEYLAKHLDEYKLYKYWWYQGQHIDCNSQEEFEQKIKLLAFL